MAWLVSQAIFYFTVENNLRQEYTGFVMKSIIDWWKIVLLKLILYQILGKIVGFCFNILNICLFGNLPPQGCISVILEDKGRFLLLKRPDGTLVFPGGFIRWRERPTQTAMREFKEETGLQVKLRDVVACYAIPSKGFGSISILAFVFCADVKGGEMRGSVEGNPCWIEETNLREMDDFEYGYMLNDYREYCEKLQQGISGALMREMRECG